MASLRVPVALVALLLIPSCSPEGSRPPDGSKGASPTVVQEKEWDPNVSPWLWLVGNLAPVEVKALCKPPMDKVYLVFVDDRRAQVAYEPIRLELADRLGQRLRENGIARATVPYERLRKLSGEDGFENLPISEVGKRLEADVVLYVEITDFSLQGDANSPNRVGYLETSVRLVDARKPERLWPMDVPKDTGHRLAPLWLAPRLDDNPLRGHDVTMELAEKTAKRIASLFHDHYEGGVTR